MAATTIEKFRIRHYEAGEEDKMTDLVNACRANDMEGLVTVGMIQDEWLDPRLQLDRDTWVVVDEEGTYIAAAEVWFNDPDNDDAVITRHIGLAMRPEYRDRYPELAEDIFNRALQHAITKPFAHPEQDYVLRIWAAAKDQWKHDFALRHGFSLVHIGYTMSCDGLDELPPLPGVEGIRIEGWSEARDRGLWEALNEAFSTDDTFVPLSWEEWRELYHYDTADPKHWCLAIDVASDRVVGMALTEVDWEQPGMGRAREAWIVDLGVVPSYRNRGIGRLLLLAALHALRETGVSAVKMGIDSTDPEHATDLYHSVGFTIFQGSHTYNRPLRTES